MRECAQDVVCRFFVTQGKMLPVVQKALGRNRLRGGLWFLSQSGQATQDGNELLLCLALVARACKHPAAPFLCCV